MNCEISSKNLFEEEGHGCFPFEYYIDFLEFLRKNDEIIEIITYDDLPWGDDYDCDNAYPKEYKSWKKQVGKGIRDDKKIYVLLQHDVDTMPERTIAIIREEDRFGIPSNIMIFNRRINRQHLKKTDELLYTEYNIDYDYLRRLQNESRFVIGYHSNAYEKALFNKERALKIFEEDIKILRQYFNIRYFSPHGGVRDHNGLTNNSLSIPESLNTTLRWVHNAKTVRFDGNYSDGGLNNPKRDPTKRDLRDFVRTWKRGKRYRVLTHPQYYNTPCKRSPRLTGITWYDNLLDLYMKNRHITAWNDIYL